jgi:16S rRNA processing protein RimM
VATEVHSDIPDRFHEGMELIALGKDSARRTLKIEGLWPHKGHLILKFAGIDSISDAETLIGSELQVPASNRAQLEEGWSYVSDLVGCTVLDGDREVGTVRDVEFGAGEAPLLVVASGSAEYEIPFASEFLVNVDLAAKQIRMRLPEGLLEVNAPLTEEEKLEQRKPK